MKPFDLEAAKRGEPIVTRDGRKARFIAHVPEAEEYRVVAMIEGTHCPVIFIENGRWSNNSESPNDLFMAAKKRTVWVNVYKNGLPPIGAVYSTQDDADKRDASDRIGNRAWPLEIEE